MGRHRGVDVVTVEDDGPGLRDVTPADLSGRTFSGTSARSRGEGLGIAIVNEIATRAGWTVVYAPRDESGLVVRVEGPLSGGRFPSQ